MKILIAEDDFTSRRILESLLSKWGHEVVAVSDGAQAWDLLQNDSSIGLLVLDWIMPEIDGLELLRKIRRIQAHRTTYILFLTACGNKEDIVTVLESGADDYLHKPFDSDELRARIDVGCRYVKMQSELAVRVLELEAALKHVKTLQGILPYCMHCRKIRTDQQSWEMIESYIESNSDAKLSHGLCPSCLKEHYPKQTEGELKDGEAS